MPGHADMRARLLAGVLCFFATAAPAAAEMRQALDAGPLEISADRAELARDGSMRYVGNVELSNEQLRVQGGTLTLRREGDAGVVIRVVGEPASLRHTPPADSDAPRVDAEALRIDFYRDTDRVELDGNVRLRRGGERLTGERLEYDLAEQRIVARGGDTGGRVRITIDPETLQRQQR